MSNKPHLSCRINELLAERLLEGSWPKINIPAESPIPGGREVGGTLLVILAAVKYSGGNEQFTFILSLI